MSLKVTEQQAFDANFDAVTTDYNIAPRIDYRTVKDVEGPLVVLENVKFPKYAEIVNVRLGNGVMRKGQVLEIKGKQAVVQVCHIFILISSYLIDLRRNLRYRQLEHHL
jgi:V-type H+-transporting ATPase subunit B